MSVADGTFVTPPGWYPDPADDARLRRWDGAQWTQEVLLAPEQQPAAPAAPSSAPPPSAQPAWQPAPAAAPVQEAPAAFSPGPPQASNQPPPGQPVPSSPPPSNPPPGMPTAPTTFQSAPEPPAQPTVPQSTVPRPSPPINQTHSSHPQSGPVSLPEWATLPGLTLPPDLSSLPGMQSDSVLHAPTFEEAERREPPTPPVFEPPFIPQRPDVQESRRARPLQVDAEHAAPTHSAPTHAAPSRPEEPKAQPVVPTPDATPYAPPPSGAQYDVPPPPGMAHVPTTGTVLPPSAFVAPQLPSAAWPQLPPVGSEPPSTAIAASPGRGSIAAGSVSATNEPTERLGTISVWLIAALPLLQFAAIYLVFGVAKVSLAPGMQWGIIAIPAAFSLLFANADKKKLTTLGVNSPSVIFGLIPPLYLIVRCITTGRSSLLPLIAWIVLQAGAAAGIYFLLHPVLLAGIRAMGIS